MNSINRPWRHALAVCAALLLAACGGNYAGDGTPVPGGGNNGGGTLPPVASAEGRAAYAAQCQSCHGADGNGTQAGPSLVACASCGDERSLTERIVTTMPLGDTEACGLDCSTLTAQYILAAFNGQNLSESTEVFEVVAKSAAPVNLRKASLSLAGRLPTAAEIEQAEQGEIDAVLDALLTEEAFYERLVEMYNDVLLQNKYLDGENALNLLRSDDYPARRWYNDLGLNRDQAGYERDLYFYLRAQTNDAVGQEVLRLIEHVVRNDRPFTEVLTADYTVANYFSARAYGAENQHTWRQLANPEFAEYPFDPADFREIRISSAPSRRSPGYEIPHAGVMTSAMFLNRFPTTETNRNRHRARMVYELFLDTDILQLGGNRDAAAVDIDSQVPTLDNPDCLVCHEVLDPVASVFQNWDAIGQYRPSHEHDGWHTDMEARGYAGKAMDLSSETINASVRWLANEMIGDPRFAKSAVKTLHKLLTGQNPLPAPAADADSNSPAARAFRAQNIHFGEVQRAFISSGYDLRVAIKAIVTGPYFSADALQAGADPQLHAASGSARLLTPEMLHRKLLAVTGERWQRSGRDRLVTRASDGLRILYGGIDSDNVTERIEDPNGVMLAMQRRMAEQVACQAVARDFYREPSERYLFPEVALDDSLLDEQGLVDGAVQPRVAANLQHLFWTLFGQRVAADDVELLEVQDLIIAVQQTGRQLAENSNNSAYRRLHFACDLDRDPETGEGLPTEQRIRDDDSQMLKAWQAVLVLMLSDYRFLYE